MSTDIVLYVTKPGEQQNFGRSPAGRISLGDISHRGERHQSQPCLSIPIEAHPPATPLTISIQHVLRPVTLSWLTLNVTMRMTQQPYRRIGHVYVEDTAMLPLGGKNRGPGSWQWELLPEDIEHVERDPTLPASGIVGFQVEIDGLAKVLDSESGQYLDDIWGLQGVAPQLTMEVSEWGRLIQSLGYKLPPSHQSIAGPSSLEDPSWAAAVERLAGARSHHRKGEDDDALRDCLSTLEALVSKPYSAEQWMEQLKSMPEQKARGIAALFSGLATYCNTVGHHRIDAERDAAGSYPAVPLDHWEADLILGVSQFVLTYALRLRK
jgi:hypothetical protein